MSSYQTSLVIVEFSVPADIHMLQLTYIHYNRPTLHTHITLYTTYLHMLLYACIQMYVDLNTLCMHTCMHYAVTYMSAMHADTVTHRQAG